MPFRYILIALDRTEKAEDVFEQGFDLTQKYGAKLTLLHCITYVGNSMAGTAVPPAGAAYPWPSAMLPTTTAPTTAMSGEATEIAIRQKAEDMQTWLADYQRRAEVAGCNSASSEIRIGKPSDCICSTASELQVDLIVIGRHDRSGLEEFLLGSVSNDVIHNASCAVLLVQS